LVPRQDSSGGEERLLGISKRGDTYLRTLLIHGARSELIRWGRNANQSCGWLSGLLQRRSPNVATVALANKNARIVWALLAHDQDYQAGHNSTRLMTIAATAR
jgi:transposase